MKKFFEIYIYLTILLELTVQTIMYPVKMGGHASNTAGNIGVGKCPQVYLHKLPCQYSPEA